MAQITYTSPLSHYTLLVRSSESDTTEKSAVVIHLRTVCPARAVTEVQIHNPFAAEGTPEATLQTESIQAAVNGQEAGHRLPIPADPASVAFFVEDQFIAGLTYEVFAVAHYSEFRPYGPPRKRTLYGVDTFLEDPFRVSFEPATETSSLQVDLFLLDSRLSAPPEVVVFDSTLGKDGRACENQPFRRSPVNNHFSWGTQQASPGSKFEVNWKMSPPDNIVQRLLRQPKDDFVESFNLLRSFVRKALLLEPGTVKEEYEELKKTLATATKKVVLIDPFIDRQLTDLLSDVKKGIQVIIVAGLAKDAVKDGAEIHRFCKDKQWNYKFRQSPSVHDRFLIIDDSRLYFSGASFKDLYRKASMIFRFEAGEQATIDFIKSLYRITHISSE
jgi:hypothetical protein